MPVAVDALVELDAEPRRRRRRAATRHATRDDAGSRALFEPRGVVVAGASTHPGKFGFVALHNILAAGYRGPGRRRRTSKRRRCSASTPCASIDELPDGPWDLVFVCTPAAANAELLRAVREARASAPRSSRARGYGEAGDDGRARRARARRARRRARHPARRARTGRASCRRRRDLCAQIVAPYPPPGRIAIASQSGNFVSSFLNWAVQTGVGVSRAVSAGNAAAVGIADYLDWYADDPETAVSLAYVEGVADGRALFERLARRRARASRSCSSRAARRAAAQRAAASHTGSLATDDRVFDGMCRQAGRHARGDDRRGVRGRGDVRDAAAAARARASRCSPPRAVGAW